MTKDQFMKIKEMNESPDPEARMLAVSLLNSDSEFLKANGIFEARNILWEMYYDNDGKLKENSRIVLIYSKPDGFLHTRHHYLHFANPDKMIYQE